MKNFLAGILAVAMLTAAADEVHGQSDKRVTSIRAGVAKINKAAGKYKKTKKDVLGISTEGAEATLFHSGKELRKIAAKIYGETFNATSEFYFSGGELIFSYSRINHYDTQIGLDKPVKVIRIEQIRSYFDHGKMFRLLIGKKGIDPKSADFAEYEKEDHETVNTIINSDGEQ